MKGYIDLTDYGWYEHLRASPGPKDANFWRPSSRALHLDVGTPVLFKLKAPHHAIAGFRYFAGFSVLPDWLAWDTFGDANGVGTLGELQERLSTIRKGAGIAADPGSRIGCCLIAEAVFFAPNDCVAPPNDWKRPIQTGATYDLSAGEGLRVWTECLRRIQGQTNELPVAAKTQARYGKPSLSLPPPRPGNLQGKRPRCLRSRLCGNARAFTARSGCRAHRSLRKRRSPSRFEWPLVALGHPPALRPWLCDRRQRPSLRGRTSAQRRLRKREIVLWVAWCAADASQ